MLHKTRIISIDVSTGNYQSFIDAILEYGRKRQSSYVCFANVHMLVEAYFSKDFQHMVNRADVVTPDGIPVSKSFQLFHNIKQERIDGMGCLPRLLPYITESRQSVYFYGSTEEMLKETRLFLQENYPALRIAGMYSPPFRPLTQHEKDTISKTITASEANIVFVILGCPKQEQWMSEMKGRIPAVMLGLGAALPVLIGKLKRAPQWMQTFYLEWLFRVCQDPRRLLKRYTVTNSVFAYLLVKELIRNRFITKTA